MTRPLSFGNAALEVESAPANLIHPESETAFKILVLGDFSGRADRGKVETGGRLGGRVAVPIDSESFDAVLEGFCPRLRLDDKIALCFRTLHDFHPDGLYQRAEVFEKLREARERLGDPTGFRTAATELGFKLRRPAQGAQGNQSAIEEPASGWTDYLRRLIAPYLTSRTAKQSEMTAYLDAATAGLMRDILHNPAFQALEAAWAGIFFLLSRLQGSTRVKLFLVDVSKAELAADLLSTPDFAATGTYRLLVEERGSEQWGALAGLYTFERTAADIEVLSRLGTIAACAGSPFLSGTGCEPPTEEDKQLWDCLRGQPQARWIGLALPGFLLRLPYGEGIDPVNSFPFEEMPGNCEHSAYLWGNPAIACALLLGKTFERCGWSFRPGTIMEIGNLPIHTYREGCGVKRSHCAETLLDGEAADAALGAGLMPLVSNRNRDTLRLVRFQSVAAQPLSGSWGA